VDNGTEFTSKILDHRTYWNGVVSRPGKPSDNPHVEAIPGTLRRKGLLQHWFLDLVEDVRQTLELWRIDYKNHRPHTSLDDHSPAEYAAQSQKPLN